MKKIASFTVDHLRLLRGVYVSRVDTLPSGEKITTYDIRMTEPNRMAPLAGDVLHTIEHLAATYLRNREDISPRVIYWGPMGCCTGNYLILAGEPDINEVVALMRDTFSFIAGYEGEVPGATPRDCGNYSYMNLEGAKKAAGIYLDEILTDPKPENLNYPD